MISRVSGQGRPRTLLCVCNFSTDTGYAWDFIASLYGELADSLQGLEIRTFVSYQRVNGRPRALKRWVKWILSRLPFLVADQV